MGAPAPVGMSLPQAAVPSQVRARVVRCTPVGDYHRLELDAGAAAVSAQPGQFVAVAVGGTPTATLLRRVFSVHRATPGGRLELVVAARGVGSEWVTRREPGDTLELTGPLGRPFPLPASAPCSGLPPGGAVVVGGGYGSAPLVWLAEVLAARGVRVAAVLGAATTSRLFGVEALVGLLGRERVRVTTDDGSGGVAGRVTDVLAEAVGSVQAEEVYACGPMPMLRAVTDVAATVRARAWCTVEESMACGVGVCMTCVLPVRGADGQTRMTRSCVEGPTFEGTALRWDALRPAGAGGGAVVPEDCVGALRPVVAAPAGTRGTTGSTCATGSAGPAGGLLR